MLLNMTISCCLHNCLPACGHRYVCMIVKRSRMLETPSQRGRQPVADMAGGISAARWRGWRSETCSAPTSTGHAYSLGQHSAGGAPLKQTFGHGAAPAGQNAEIEV